MEESQNGIFSELGLALPAQANMGLPPTLPENSNEVSLQKLCWRGKKVKKEVDATHYHTLSDLEPHLIGSLV